MKIIEQSATWEQEPPANTLEIIERAGRTCYKSEGKSCEGSAPDFVRRILGRQHESVIEHVSASVRFVTDRGVTHEMVRHRIASYSQESTRYCNYSKDQFGEEITVILPVWFYDRKRQEEYKTWEAAMMDAECGYLKLLAMGTTAQEARAVLPNSLKTEIVMTANLREWLHFFKLRTAPAAHPQMRDLALQALCLFQMAVPVLFGSIGKKEA